jgi:dipeptidyl aminopeptidase/acylaminoacyl peptidase
MRTSRLLRGVLVLCGLAWCLGTAAASNLPPAEAFAGEEQTRQVVLSPDGNTLAWLSDAGQETRIVIFDIATHKPKSTVRIDRDLKVRTLNWSDNETLLYDVSSTDHTALRESERFEFFRVVALDVPTRESHILLMTGGSRPRVTGSEVVLTHAKKPKTVVMTTYDYSAPMARPRLGSHISGRRRDSGWISFLYNVDTRTGNASVIDFGSQFTSQWVVDQNGTPVARSEWDSDGNVFRVLAKNGLGWREILRRENAGMLSVQGLTADGKAVVAVGSLDRTRPKLLALPLDGSAARVLLEDPDRDVLAVVLDRFTGAPLGAWLGGVEPRYRWLDPKVEQLNELLARTFPNRRVMLYSRSLDSRRMIAYVSGPSHPAAFYLMDLTTNKAEMVGEEFPKLADVPLGEVQVVSYSARDGTEIPAYLTLPPGGLDKNLPLVVLPHGGPEDRDEFAFDWWPQFLATRGYAVLQPQYRGSAGFGDAFRLAGRKQWGGLMQDDVTDGVKWLIKRGVADPRRVCIVGSSYGGYAALAGAAFTPELYACAASINGIASLSELGAYVREHFGEDSNQVGYWRDDIGSPLDPEVAARSPVNAVANIRSPVMLMYSTDDTIVPPSQSESMARALQRSGKDVSLVQLGGDDHWLSRSATRVRVLKELDSFLAKNLGSGAGS